jgi:anti-anti-sigma factor
MSTTEQLEIGSRLETLRRLFRVPAAGGHPTIPTSSPVSSTALTAPHAKPVAKLDVVVLEAADEVIVRLGGETGFMETTTLEASLRPLSARCPKSVTFDLIELRFLSSLSLSVLITFRRAAVRRGVRVCIAPDMQPEVRDMLETAGVLELFEVSGDFCNSQSQAAVIGGAGIQK